MRKYSRKYEKHETPSEERRESAAYERKEHMMGWEMPLHEMHHKSHKHHMMKWGSYFGEPHNVFSMNHKKRK